MAEPNLSLTFVGVFLLIAINAFFVTAEFSIVSVRRSRISQLVRDGDLQAQTVQSLQRSIDRLLSTTQLGITLSSLALGWVGRKNYCRIANYFYSTSRSTYRAVKHYCSFFSYPLIIYYLGISTDCLWRAFYPNL